MKIIRRIALAGNPNCGKSTILNALTGARQHVGNYPGVTVEKKSGYMRLGREEIELIDLPGIYSLGTSSPEELVTRDELTTRPPELILNILDASTLERGLYLTFQLALLGIPMILVLNMFDEAEEGGFRFDLPKLEKLLKVRVIATVGSRGIGLDALRNSVADFLDGKWSEIPQPRIYPHDLEDALKEVAARLADSPVVLPGVPEPLLLENLLEDDPMISGRVAAMDEGEALLASLQPVRDAYRAHTGVAVDVALQEHRHALAAGVFQEVVRRPEEDRARLSDSIDRVVTHPVLGIPIFLGMMLLVFKLTFAVGDPLVGLLESLFSFAGEQLAAHWPAAWPQWLESLLVDGVLAGVGGVLVFLPNILLLFMAIAMLEGSGYMARAAFIMDKVMHKMGLHGKSFIPMLIGFGCTVPAIMATRTIESKEDRYTTIMVLPLMSCAARLTIFSLFIPVFFAPRYQALVMTLIYLVGVGLAIVAARLMKSTLFKGDDELFVMELPPYRMPTVRSILIHMWERAVLYLQKAATVLLFASILMWVCNNYPEPPPGGRDFAAEKVAVEKLDPEAKSAALLKINAEEYLYRSQYSILGRLGRSLEVVMKPLGFDWRASASLVGAAAGKELFVSQLGILYAESGDTEGDMAGLRTVIRSNYTALQGVAIMIFCLISMPCFATFAVTRRETNSWRWPIFQATGLTVVAYLVTLAVYQTGLLLGLG